MYIINLDSVDGGTQGVGSKAASLGTLAKAGFQVPPGFVIKTEAFEKFLTDTGIRLLLPKILENVSQEEPRTAVLAFNQIKELFAKFSGTDFLIREVKGAYNELSFGKDVSIVGGMALDLIRAGRGDCFVSVRSSVACEKPVSFAGHGKAYLNLIGYRQILAGIKDCWLSFFSPEALIYRKIQGIEGSLALIVQKMVDSELSGNLFTSEPVSGDSKILIEGWWGLGETLCCGCVLPDQYLIAKDGVLVSRRTGKKIWLRRRGPLSGMTIQEKVPASRVYMDTLSDRDFEKFASIAQKIESLLGQQHVEWAVERGRIVILQSRPVVFSKGQSPQQEFGEKIFSGLGVSAGIGKGKVKVINEISGILKPEEPAVLVTKNLAIELLPFMRWFSGIVTEQGGCGSCMASLGRELGIPIVCGIENAGVILQNGKEIVVDGLTGGIYAVR
ncbi:MAG: PEP-utilizing enzyme [Candidatus Aenigmarchaeota archaeon]|nr:PEP-utilizing enzyme [Candidatus Aenigmarchaeota archaeon]